MESGVSKSTLPSLVCAIWAAADNFLCDLLRGLYPGIEER